MQTLNVTTIGRLCEICQAPIGWIRGAAEFLAIEPALTINDVPHYSDADVAAIAERVEVVKQELAKKRREQGQ